MGRSRGRFFRLGLCVALCTALTGGAAPSPAHGAQGDLGLGWVAPATHTVAFVAATGVALSPTGGATQDRTVFVADPGSRSVTGIEADGTLRGPWTSAGGEAFLEPTDVAADANGYVYVADAQRPYIYKLNAGTGALVEKIGSGLSRPVGLDWHFVSGGGHQLYVADAGNKKVVRFSDTSDVSTGFAFTGGSALEAPADVDAVLTGEGLRLWVTDTTRDKVLCIDSLSGNVLTSWGVVGAADGELTDPTGIGVRGDNSVVVSDAAGRVQCFTQGGIHLATLVGPGAGDGELTTPRRLALDPANDFMWVAEAGAGRVQLFNGAGGFQRKVGGGRGGGLGSLDAPTALAVCGANLYACDTGNDRVQVFDAVTGEALFAFGGTGAGAGEFERPQGIAIDREGAVYVADTLNDRVQKFDAAGEHLDTFGSSGAGPGQFSQPKGIAVDAQGFIYVADSGNYRIQKLTPSGEPAAQWSGYTYKSATRNFYRLSDIALGPDGNLFVYDGFASSYAYGSTVVELRPDGALVQVHFDSVGSGPVARWAGIDVGAGRMVVIGGNDSGAPAEIRMKPWVPGTGDSGDYVNDSAGIGPGEYVRAGDVALGPFGALFVSDPALHRIQRFTVEDVTPPETSVWSHSYLDTWSDSDVGVFIDRPTDGLAGPVETRLALDGEDQGAVWSSGQDTWQSSQRYLVVSKEGTTTLGVSAVDAFGNREETQTVVVKIDRHAPEATVTVSPSGWTTGTATVSVDATDSGSGVSSISYWLNGGLANPLPYDEAFTIDSEGATAVGVKVLDAAGFATIRGGYAKIDRTPPVTRLDVWDHQISENQWGVMLWATATGDGAELEQGGVSTYWVVDDGPVPQVGQHLLVSIPGTHTVEYWSVDAAGNVESRQTTEVVVGGGSGGGGDPGPGGGDPPVGGFHIAGGRAWFNRNELPIASNVAGAAEMRFKAPGDPDWRGWMPYVAETTLVVSPDQPDGEWTVLAQYRDAGGEVSDAQSAIRVDRTPPSTRSNANEPRNFFATEDIVLVPEDAGSGIREVWYRVGDSDPVRDVTTIRLPAGTHTLRWWSVDNAGNVESVNEKTVTVVLFPTTMATTSGSATIAFGGTYTLTGRLTADGRPLAARSVILQRLSGSTWVDTATRATTDAGGYFSFPLRPADRTSYRPRFAATGTHEGAVGGAVIVTPRAVVGTPVTPKTMYVSKSLTVYGSLKPRHASGQVVRIYRERLVGSTWKKYGYVNAKAANSSDGFSRYSVAMRFPAKGTWRLKAVHPADAGHPLAESAWKKVTVK